MAPPSNQSSIPTEPPDIPEYRCPRCGSTRAVGRLGTSERVSGTGPSGTYEAVTRAVMICEDCRLIEDLLDDKEGHDAYVVAIRRWINPEFDEAKPYYSTVAFHSETRDRMLMADARDRRHTWPDDPVDDLSYYEQKHARYLQRDRENGLYLPENDALFAQVIAHPEDTALRWDYATWLGQQPPSLHKDDKGNWAPSPDDPKLSAWRMTAQLQTWEALRVDPKADVAQYMYDATENYQTDILRLRGSAKSVNEHHFLGLNFVQSFSVRGFIEHVSIKAPAFLQFAAFLYSIAPLRHLTVTYAKRVMAELAASPHLGRICTLVLPNRILDNEYTRLNELTDEDIAVLASSPHLGNLTLLDLADNDQLTIRAFDHLALSPHLPSLSNVAFEVYDYDREFGRFGAYRRKLAERRNEAWRDELEARHGYLPWLHPEEHYGVPVPRLEQVTAHPVGVASFRPDVAARRRAQLPTDLIEAIRSCVVDDGRIGLRQRSLTAELGNSDGVPDGEHSGRLVATIVDATPDAAIPDLRALVTLTIEKLAAPAPISAYDHKTGTNVVLAERQTITVGIPLRSYSLPAPEPIDADAQSLPKG